MLKRTLLGLTAATLLAFPMITVAHADSDDEREHPRIARAIHDLEVAVAYLEQAPHDFGGHKVRAIADARAAIIELRESLRYREHREHEHHDRDHGRR